VPTEERKLFLEKIPKKLQTNRTAWGAQCLFMHVDFFNSEASKDAVNSHNFGYYIDFERGNATEAVRQAFSELPQQVPIQHQTDNQANPPVVIEAHAGEDNEENTSNSSSLTDEFDLAVRRNSRAVAATPPRMAEQRDDVLSSKDSKPSFIPTRR
jgi:hypothetical protein